MKRLILVMLVLLFALCAFAEETQILYVESVDGANVRRGPALSSGRLGTAWSGCGVELIGYEGDFAHVRLVLNGQEIDGYVWASLLTKEKPDDTDLKLNQVIASSTGLFMRMYPDMEAPRICVLPCGTAVVVHNYCGSYAYISYRYGTDIVRGYASADNLAVQCDTKPDSTVKLKRFCGKCRKHILDSEAFTLVETEDISYFVHVECPQTEIE